MALGRKNHLFAGSDGGGERWAMFCSLIATAKLNGIEPYAYLRDVLKRMIDGHSIKRLDDLLPWDWASKTCQPLTDVRRPDAYLPVISQNVDSRRFSGILGLER